MAKISAIKSTLKMSNNFKNWLNDYLKNSSIAGCVHYVSPTTGLIGGIFWIVAQVVSITSVIYMILNATIDFNRIPTVTTAETGKYPIGNVDFPAVAICGLNKINYSAAVKLGEDILDYYPDGNFTLKEVTDMVKYLGHLYLFELNDVEEDTVNLLHNLLRKRYKKYVPDVLKQIVPSCQRFLEYCSWDGREEYCEDIFYVRKTGDGYCCTFNYARKNDDFYGKNSNVQTWEAVDVKRSKLPGPRFGLTVLISADIMNHHYKILPALGYKVLIYPPSDFPDAPSGGVREVLISPRTVASLTLHATPFYSVPEVSRYDHNRRGCLFNDELFLMFGKYYSYSDCIMYCRINDMYDLCNCVPFFYPLPSGEKGRMRVCDLKDLPCLKKHRDRWIRPIIDQNRVSLTENIISNGTLDCTICFPACKDILYQVSINSAPLTSSSVYMGGFLHELKQNQSIINVFFKHSETVRLKQDVLFYWYDLLSNYGGLCGLFLGVSVISVFELFYFLTLRLYNQKYEIRKKGRKSRITFVQAAKLELRPLYWNEMIQPNTKY